jgi:hypothetical protein
MICIIFEVYSRSIGIRDRSEALATGLRGIGLPAETMSRASLSHVARVAALRGDHLGKSIRAIGELNQ